MAAKALNDARFAAGLAGYKFIVGPAKAKREYVDGKPTGKTESVRVDLISQEVGSINLDLTPFTEEKLQKVQELFATVVTTDNLIKISGFKTSTIHQHPLLHPHPGRCRRLIFTRSFFRGKSLN